MIFRQSLRRLVIVYGNRVQTYTTVMNKMNALLLPPDDVRGMKVFKIDKFTKPITVPVISVDKSNVDTVNKVLKNYIIKLRNFKSIRCGSEEGQHMFFLDPTKFSSYNDLGLTCVTDENLDYTTIVLGYDNWNHNDILKAVLPEQSMLSSYSMVGSILHVNLKPELLDYKSIIGKILYDKIKGCKSVVNKIDNINNVYRNFEYEVICGSSDLKTTVKENNCTFYLDFSEVYWNPRLCTEHERILKQLRSGDVLYDIFAGIGPFSIPAAKKKCIVLANDLNPKCCKWLTENKKINRIEDEFLTIVNKDGSAFIQEDLKAHLILWSKKITSENKIHVTMNLPELSCKFIKYFDRLIEWDEISDHALPIVHVYVFAKSCNNNYEEDLKSIMKEYFKNVNPEDIREIIRVRKVAPNKEMLRITFHLKKETLCKSEIVKKRKSDEREFENVKKNKENSSCL